MENTKNKENIEQTIASLEKNKELYDRKEKYYKGQIEYYQKKLPELNMFIGDKYYNIDVIKNFSKHFWRVLKKKSLPKILVSTLLITIGIPLLTMGVQLISGNIMAMPMFLALLSASGFSSLLVDAGIILSDTKKIRKIKKTRTIEKEQAELLNLEHVRDVNSQALEESVSIAKRIDALQTINLVEIMKYQEFLARLEMNYNVCDNSSLEQPLARLREKKN